MDRRKRIMNNKKAKIGIFQILLLLIGFLSLIYISSAESLDYSTSINPHSNKVRAGWSLMGGGGVSSAATVVLLFIAPWFSLIGLTFLGISLSIGLSETTSQTITYDCQPWIPPVGENCESCNDGDIPCSEYRCKSLGTSCEYVNHEEGSICLKKMSEINPPTIRANDTYLTEGYKYILLVDDPTLGGEGYKITQIDGTDYIKSAEGITFGFSTDEQAYCKISMFRINGFEKAEWVDSSSRPRKEFKQFLKLPTQETINENGLYLKNDNEMTYYVWCRDNNGNTNPAPYIIRFNVDPLPDKTVPQVLGSTFNANERCVGNSDMNITFRIKDSSPIAECRWSREDLGFKDMLEENSLECRTSSGMYETELCDAEINGVAQTLTSYYIACNDSQGNYNLKSAYELKLRTAPELRISSIAPESGSTIYGTIEKLPVTLLIQTLSGCNDGKATCEYIEGPNPSLANRIKILDTNNDDGVTNKTLYLGQGDHEYLIRCTDEGGNTANQTIKFRVEIDTQSPIIARLYEDSGNLKIITGYDAVCVYSYDSCDVDFEDGTVMQSIGLQEHFVKWDKEKTYYVKCKDKYRAEPTDCSTIVRPASNI